MEDRNNSGLRYLILRVVATVGPVPKDGPTSVREIVGYVRASDQDGLPRAAELERQVEHELALLEHEGHVELSYLEDCAQYRVTQKGREHFDELVATRPPASYAPRP